MSKRGGGGAHTKSAAAKRDKAQEAIAAATRLYAKHLDTLGAEERARRESAGIALTGCAWTPTRSAALLTAMQLDSVPCAMMNCYAAPEAIDAYLRLNAPVRPVPGVALPVFTIDSSSSIPGDDRARPAAGSTTAAADERATTASAGPAGDEAAASDAGVAAAAALPAVPARRRLFTGVSADTYGVCVAYHIDPASLLAVQALDVEPNDKVLDMCAAPGGKSLAIAQMLSKSGSLTSNDVASDRKRRLQEVLSLYVPKAASRLAVAAASAEAFAEPVPLSLGAQAARAASAGPPTIHVISADGTKPGAFGRSQYDRVLLDAPCSSDRHMLHDAEELVKWGPGKVKANAQRQVALLHTALEAVVDHGVVVYSTCAVSYRENDAVVATVISESEFPVAIVPLRFVFGEQTPLGGWHVLPDTADGFGPLYICKLVKGVRRAPKAVRGDFTAVRWPPLETAPTDA